MKAHRRDFLNPKTGSAFAETTAEVCPANERHLANVSASISIADCSRIIALDFSADNKEEVVSRLAKLALLQQHLGLLEDILLEYKAIAPTKKQVDAHWKSVRDGKKNKPITVSSYDLD